LGSPGKRNSPLEGEAHSRKRVAEQNGHESCGGKDEREREGRKKNGEGKYYFDSYSRGRRKGRPTAGGTTEASR
jgi:hypothetical protein